MESNHLGLSLMEQTKPALKVDNFNWIIRLVFGMENEQLNKWQLETKNKTKLFNPINTEK